MEEPTEILTIGVLAEAAGVNVETIRFYQRKGLMQEPDRPLGGIRRYGEPDLARVRFIKSAQRLGFSLDEIGDLLFAVVNLARKLRVDPELALRGSAIRFRERVEGAARAAGEDGLVFEDMELDEQEECYLRAKRKEQSPGNQGGGDSPPFPLLLPLPPCWGVGGGCRGLGVRCAIVVCWG